MKYFSLAPTNQTKTAFYIGWSVWAAARFFSRFNPVVNGIKLACTVVLLLFLPL
jgi:hypothetical protein